MSTWDGRGEASRQALSRRVKLARACSKSTCSIVGLRFPSRACTAMWSIRAPRYFFACAQGFLGDLTFSAIFGGGISAYCALRKDIFGSLTRDVGGKSARTMFDKAKDYERELQLTEKIIDRVSKLFNLVASDLKKWL